MAKSDDVNVKNLVTNLKNVDKDIKQMDLTKVQIEIDKIINNQNPMNNFLDLKLQKLKSKRNFLENIRIKNMNLEEINKEINSYPNISLIDKSSV